MKPLILTHPASAILGQNGLDPTRLPDEFSALFPEQSPKYIDALSLLAGVAAGRIFLRGENPPRPSPDDAVILGSAFGALESSVDFDRQALLKGPQTVNPMDFPNTVANAAGSRIGIWLQLKGPNVTLTNGETSFIDALGFAWEGMNGGLFNRCLVGAADKLPDLLKTAGLAVKQTGSFKVKEGAFLFLATGDEGEGFLQVEDYVTAQWKADGILSTGFKHRLSEFFRDAEWIGLPEVTPVEALLPPGLFRFIPEPSVLELGLGGLASLVSFLSSSQSVGVVGAVAVEERRISLVRIRRRKRS